MSSISQVQKSQKEKKLPDIASECLILILQLRSTNNYGNVDTFKTKINEMFESFERNARSAGIENEKVQQAKFALVAFLDETIICSSWNQKNEWLTEPLQLKLFDTFNAGEEFFNNLTTLRQRTNSNKDILEVFFLCLVLGFKGKYQLHSPENLRRVIDDLNMELHPQMYNVIDTLSPNAKAKDNFISSAKSRIPVWIYPLAAIVVSVVFYWVMSASISDRTTDTIEVIKLLNR